MRAWFGVTSFLLTLNKHLSALQQNSYLINSSMVLTEGWAEYMAFSFPWSVLSLARHWRYTIAAHSGILNVPEIGLQYVKLSKTFQFPIAGAVFTGEQSLHWNEGTALAASHTKQLRLSRSGFFVICKFKGTLKSKQTNKTWSTVIGKFSLLSIRQENIFDIWLFFSCHAFVFEYSSALFSHFWHSPLNKPNEAQWNSFQLSVNIYNNCRSSQRQWPILFGCSQTMTVLLVTRCCHAWLPSPLCRHVHVSLSPCQLASQVQQRGDSGKTLARNCAKSCWSHVENGCNTSGVSLTEKLCKGAEMEHAASYHRWGPLIVTASSSLSSRD